MRLISLLLFWCFLVDTKADVAFTWPISGAVLGSGDITLWWKEDGDALLIRKMGSHLLVLFTGSNNVMVCYGIALSKVMVTELLILSRSC